MENEEQEDVGKDADTRMSADEAALLLSRTMRDVTERKITLRHALVVSRIAVALAKVIETADLNDRVEFLEEALKKRKTI
jgi:hypothetical protein